MNSSIRRVGQWADAGVAAAFKTNRDLRRLLDLGHRRHPTILFGYSPLMSGMRPKPDIDEIWLDVRLAAEPEISVMSSGGTRTPNSCRSNKSREGL
jgi:hypothetical protein